MLARFFALIVLCVASISSFSCAENLIHDDVGKHLYPNVEKVSNDFYIGRIPGKNLWLVMQRVTSENSRFWQQYIDVQSNSRVVAYASRLGQKGNTGDGSLHFKAVLTAISPDANEIWVAYITRAERPIPISKDIMNYNAEHIDNYYAKREGNSFAQDIEMFVTVTSTPNALITSHMGIASSVEGAVTRTKGTSIDLHSFAAKVMLMRNPNRRYMVNAPVFAMEKIIIDALPKGVFVGTREMQKVMEERQHVTREEFFTKNSNLEKDIRERVVKRAEETRDRENESLDRQIQEWKQGKLKGYTEQELIKEAIEDLSPNSSVEMSKDGKFVVSESNVKLRIKNQANQKFEEFKNPYVFVPSKDNPAQATEEFLKFMKLYPPILSVGGGERYAEKNFTIFDKENPTYPWLEFDATNKDYQWMFMEPFRPTGATHYIVVDLVALANSKALGPIGSATSEATKR